MLSFGELLVNQRGTGDTMDLKEILKGTYTVEEFLELDLPEDEKYELMNGKIVPNILPRSSALQGELIFKLSGYLFSYLQGNPIGRGFASAGCALNNSTVARADLCFVDSERGELDFTGVIPIAPDFVVEIFLPEQTMGYNFDRIKLFMENGVKLLWVVSPTFEYVLVYRQGKISSPQQLVDYPDVLDGENILPGFKLPVKDLLGESKQFGRQKKVGSD
jgi:Uma2 family endonuclease